MKTQNSREILDAHIRNNQSFLDIENKAKECRKIENNISKLKNDCLDIYRQIFNNFCSKRIKLGLYCDVNNIDEEKNYKWKKEISKDYKDYWRINELCLNTMGFSLRPSYQERSNSVFELEGKELVKFFSSLDNEVIMDKLKEILDDDKLDILNRAIANIKNIENNRHIERTKEYIFSSPDKNSETKIEKYTGNIMAVSFTHGGIYIIFGKLRKVSSWETEPTEINVINMSLREKIVVEQTSEQIRYMLNEFKNHLKNDETKHKEYLEQIKELFNKELIILSLTK